MHEVLVKCRPNLVFVSETRTAFQGTTSFWEREGYVLVRIEEAAGHFGGLWALHRRGSVYRFQVEDCMRQCISVKVSRGNQSWLCSGIYASPTFSVRCQLWDYLRDLRRRIICPWVLMGDVNDILLPSEQRGGVFSRVRAEAFSGVLNDCGLMDLEFVGSKFTWQKNCVGGRLISHRPDRGLGDHNWRMTFPEGTIEHLSRRHSDHSPILLRCSNAIYDKSGRPFRFQAAWYMHEGYPTVVRNAWARGRGVVPQSLFHVKEASILFNKETFGNIFGKKRELEARLKGIQKRLEVVDSASLVFLQSNLPKEYEKILFEEETFWFQKSREKWVRLGSRNTSFFHAKTVVRRKRNKIHGLHLPSGEWCTDEDLLKRQAVHFFRSLFGSKENVSDDATTSLPSIFSKKGRTALTKPVTKEEVHQALMSMMSYKAPGPDGFQPIFFKLFWDEVGDEVWSFVRDAFATGYFDPSLTETLIVLIPKGDNPTSFKEFRPISLCNVVYKLISKVPVACLRPFLNALVSPHQSSFIPWRGTVDNAIVLQEVVYMMGRSRKKKGDLVLKLDLEKAYDRVDWGFLKSTLSLFGFPTATSSLIMLGITSATISLLWNGNRTDSFNPVRGLRQGDPLSPYLFVLCMERLGYMISKEVQEQRWTPIQVSQGGPSLSHLFFADDVLLFTKAKPSQARLVADVLQKFCSISGLKVSLEKLTIYVTQGIP